MELAAKITILFSGCFFMLGLVTGIWKYAAIWRSESSTAAPYIDIAHRASLMYAFASLVILKFVELSPYSDGLTLLFALGPQIFFALAIATYIIHGVLKDTDNQLAPPFRLGTRHLPGWIVHGFMIALVVAETGGFLALLVGGIYTLFMA